MPVTLTVIDAITEELIARLENLISPSSEQTTVSEVVQPTRLGTFTPKDLQIVVINGELERVEELDCPGNPPAEAWRQTFNLYLHVQPSEDDTTDVDGIKNRFMADVRKVVCTPQNGWHTFDDNAIDANWRAPEDIDSGEAIDGVKMPLSVLYRISENDPYTSRA